MSIPVVCPEGHPVAVHADKLGGTVFCPHCFTSFRAKLADVSEIQARKEERKSKRSRDDDDDDEEDEEEEKPRKKKSAKKSRAEEEDEDEDEEDEDDEGDNEDLAPKVLNKRQRMLKSVNLGLGFIAASLVGVSFLVIISWISNSVLMFVGSADETGAMTLFVLQIFKDIFLLLVVLLMLVGTGIGLFGPSRAETRGTIFGCMVFGGLVLLFALIYYLVPLILTTDELRKENIRSFFLFFKIFCALIFILMVMSYLKQLASYLKDFMLASQILFLLMELLGWFAAPQIIAFGINYSVNRAEPGIFMQIFASVAGLFNLASMIVLSFKIYRWTAAIGKIRAMVNKAIEDE
jgi:cation transport ATPase